MSDEFDPYEISIYSKPSKASIQKDIIEEQKSLGVSSVLKPPVKVQKKVFNPYANKKDNILNDSNENNNDDDDDNNEDSEAKKLPQKRKKTDEELPENIDLTQSAYDPKVLAKKAKQDTKTSKNTNQFTTNNSSSAIDSTEDDDEPELPLLEELGINPSNIKNKIISILTLKRIDKQSLENSDMAGPFLIFILFAFSLVLQKKFCFAYLYGISVFGSIMLFLLMNLMSKKEEILLYNTISVLGYCLIPVVIFSFISVFFPINNIVGYILCAFVIGSSTVSATRFFEVALNMPEQKYLILYPVSLFYICFVLVGNY